MSPGAPSASESGERPLVNRVVAQRRFDRLVEREGGVASAPCHGPAAAGGHVSDPSRAESRTVFSSISGASGREM